MSILKDAYAGAWARAKERHPFANADEGDTWMANWCERCAVEAAYRNNPDTNYGCPLILVAIQGRTPAEWLDGPRDEHGRYSMANQYTCTNYEEAT